jgi:hypothetical protein
MQGECVGSVQEEEECAGELPMDFGLDSRCELVGVSDARLCYLRISSNSQCVRVVLRHMISSRQSSQHY